METLKLLVVDDEPGIRSGVIRILRNHRVSYPFMDEDFNFDCSEAATGEEALEMINRDTPDIVLLDNKLPGIKGMEVLEIIRQKKLDTVVAMITSYASLEIAVKATNDGAYDFIPKPFTPQELKSSMDNIVKQLYLKRITREMNKEGKRIRYQFLSVLSHELKAPLNAVEGYLQVMQERKMGEELTSYDQVIDRCLQRIGGMRGLIMDLLDFTKIRLEKKDEKVERVELNERISMAISTVNPMAIQRNISFEVEAPVPVVVEADPSDIDIILNNLISNAVKYNTEGGEVTIRLEQQDTEAKIVIMDTGIGMSPEEVSQLFKEFVRIKNVKTKDITGSGLGLAIVRKLIELYRGDIDVESIPDRGSTFTVTLPLGYL